jgi:hypothetical protein
MANIQADWTRWCHHSIVKHFHDALNAKGYVHVEGRQLPDPDPIPRFEIRIDGPYFNQVSKGCWFLDVEINVLIVTARNARDVYLHQRIVGAAAAAFTDVIEVKKYGDDESLIGCFQEKSVDKMNERIVISNFGIVDPTNRLNMSTAEGHYQMCLKEG